MKKYILILLFGFLWVSASAQSDTSSNWSYSDKINEMTNDHSYYAETSDNTQDVKATLTVRYMKKSNEVIFTVNGGIFNIIGSGMMFKAKFDNNSIDTFGSIKSDSGYDTFFVYGTNRFLKKLKQSKVLFIQYNIYNHGVYTFKFNT